MKSKSVTTEKTKMVGFINKVDPSLDKYQEMDLFKEKIAEVKEILIKAGVSKVTNH